MEIDRLLKPNGYIEQWGVSTTTTVNLPIEYTALDSFAIVSAPAANHDVASYLSEFFRPQSKSVLIRRNPNSWNCYWNTKGY